MTAHRDEELDRLLDRTIAEIRDERLDPKLEQAASARVWQRVSHALDEDSQEQARAQRIRSCADFQAMLPDYVANRLPEARHLLLQDHLGECVPCRRALKDRRAKPHLVASARRSGRSGWAATLGWRVAAAAVILLTIIGFSWKTDLFSIESGGLIRIEAIEGELFRVTDDGAVPLRLGDELTLEEGDALRTAKDSTAMIALADSSKVEMRERSQLAVQQRSHLFPGRRTDGLLGLERGSIIVEASDQGSGHLYVDTADCNVAVTGTVFSVSHGMKGSRVSVVEGEVRVAFSGSDAVLHPGDQTTTRDSLDPVPVEADIAWSRNSAQYRQLLREMQALGREIDAVLQPGLRYATDLLDVVPAGTAIYVAMPNMSDELGRAYEVLQDRLATSEVLRRWWDEQVVRIEADGTFEQIIDKINTFGDYLDEEIVMTLQLDPGGDVKGPLFLARVTNGDAIMQLLEDEIATAEATYEHELDVMLLQGELPMMAPAPEDTELYFWTWHDILAMTPAYDDLRALEASLQGHAGANLVGTAFHDRLRELYRNGVEWAVGVHLEQMIDSNASTHAGMEEMGLLDVQHVIAERKQVDGRTEQRATLTFDQPRRRMAAWLAEPGPMGVLDYVSPDANLAAAFVMKDMGVVVSELFDIVGSLDDDFEESLAEFEREAGIDIRRDLAAPLGGEFAVALDGPVLPVPSWKVILEVYDPARFEQSLEQLIRRVNEETAETGRGANLSLERETVGGRDYLRLASLDTGLEAHFVFDGGYLLAGPSRGLLDRTLQNKAMGIRLTDSPSFLDLIPRDEQVNFSAVVYQNVAPILGPLSETLSTLGNANDLDGQLWSSLSADARPSLALLYGERDQIILASSSEGGLISSALQQLSGAGGLLGMQQSLARALEHEVGNR